MSDKPSLDEQIEFMEQTCEQTLLAGRRDAAQVRAILDTLQHHKLALEMLDDAFHYDAGDLLYDQQAVNVAHRVLSGGELPRETET